MPELPEVEVVRRGLENHLVGRCLTRIEILGARTARRQEGGAGELIDRLQGRTVTGARRRGKYLWLILDQDERPGVDTLFVHLGMSGQMLVCTPDVPLPKHLGARAHLSDGRELRFIDQRTFGGWTAVPLAHSRHGGSLLVPASAAHIAPDPFDPEFSTTAVAANLRRRGGEIKRQLLDQAVVSGIGNIYADEALWRSQLHGRRLASGVTLGKLQDVLESSHQVMSEALEVGGTSFDSLYVNVNGASGYFSRSLDAYGREGQPCRRCGTAISRERFMNRSSHFCPVCQRRPRS